MQFTSMERLQNDSSMRSNPLLKECGTLRPNLEKSNPAFGYAGCLIFLTPFIIIEISEIIIVAVKHDRRDPGYWLRLCLFGDRVFAHWFANEQGGRGKSGGSATELLWSAATLFYEALNDVIGSLDHLEGLPHETQK